MTQKLTPGFSVTDPATWPVLLRDDEVAAIFQIAVATLKKRAAKGTFVPAPIGGVTPRRYRRVDVVRFVESARGSSFQSRWRA